ncbi:complement component receptor 1-like protein isoform X2 [Hyperolius riggenbachi]|uniref:complement component receptor 1-like protein isoform X2 n=1 Tax=Hyperolius riggenbachi TaxID=752182 RepID=UPI0035A3B410
MERKCVSAMLWVVLVSTLISSVHCDCGSPPPIENSMLKEEHRGQTTFPVKSVVRYDCDPGYVRVPMVKNFLTCEGNSRWSENKPFCKRRSCGYPGDTDNGDFEAETFEFGSRVTYFCNPGYIMFSKKNYRYCTADGTWSNAVPTCEATMCPSPPTIPGGSFYPVKDEYQYQDAVRYTCNDPSAVMEHDSSVFCMESGNWSDPEPRCRVVNCPAPHVPNSKKISGFVGPYTLNSVVRFECVDQRYKMEGPNTITCNLDSEWEPQLPNCTRLYCPEPILANGTVYSGKKQDGSYDINDSITLKCDQGYRIRGERTLRCGRNYKWNYDFPVCVPGSYCPEPKLLNGGVEEGERVDGSYDVNHAITLACNEGYKLIGEETLRCRNNYQWNKQFPTCELEEGCKLPKITNGRVILKNGYPYKPNEDGRIFSPSDTISIECHDGYKLHGKALIKCISGYIQYYWKPDSPQCRNTFG